MLVIRVSLSDMRSSERLNTREVPPKIDTTLHAVTIPANEEAEDSDGRERMQSCWAWYEFKSSSILSAMTM